MQLSDSLANLDRMVSIAIALKDIDLEQDRVRAVPDGCDRGRRAARGPMPQMRSMRRCSPTSPSTLSGDTGGSVAESGRGGDRPRQSPGRPRRAARCHGGSRRDPAPTTVLPSDVKGQTAGQATCSNGRTLDDQ